jgi:hypothetical protein
MPFDFSDLDEKLKNNTLTWEDLIRKALAINVALRKHIADNGNYKNHIFQGYIAWVILYEYLSRKKGLNLEISNFLALLKEQLDLASEALTRDFHNPIRNYIIRLNEAEISRRSPQGKIYTEYTEEQKFNVLNFLKENGLIRVEDGEIYFNVVFYLFYRERDGRFFLISEKKIDFGQALKLDSCFAEDLKSTHICINESFDYTEIFKQKFLEYHKQHKDDPPPCIVEGEGNFIYCGEAFKDIQLSGEMARIELCKNPPAEEIHCLYLTGSIVKYKEKLGMLEQKIPVPLHITIGRKLRQLDPQIINLATEELVNLLEQCENSYTKPLLKNKYLFATETNSLAKEGIEKLRYGFFPLVAPEEMVQWDLIKKKNEFFNLSGCNKPW